METFVRCIWDKVRSVFSEWEGAVRMGRYASWDVPLSAVWVVSKSRQNGLQEERSSIFRWFSFREKGWFGFVWCGLVIRCEILIEDRLVQGGGVVRGPGVAVTPRVRAPLPILCCKVSP